MYAICQKHFQTSQMAIWFYDMAELGNWYGSKVQIGSGWNSKVVYVLGTILLDFLFMDRESGRNSKLT